MATLGKIASPHPQQPKAADRLDSWKEIAAYLKRSVRTVRRWETEQGLPVHRHVHQSSGTVYAFESELDAWWSSRAVDFIADEPAEALSELGTERKPVLVRWLAIVGAVTVVSVLIFAAYRIERTTPAPARVMLAVLPLENLSPDASQDYISDGLTEEIITELGRLNPQRLGVIARTSVAGYKKTPKPVDVIGHELNVDFVLEGSVRQQGDQIRVAAQLIRVKDQTHIWAKSYDRTSRDLLAMEAEVAQALSRATEVELAASGTQHQTRGPSSNQTAHDAYLMGRYLWNKRSPEALRESLVYFKKAIEADPTYARAYVGLSDYYEVLPAVAEVPASEATANAEAAATKALELDPALGEAYATLASIASSRWQWDEAGKKFRHAIALVPNYATAHQWYAEYLQVIGNLKESEAEFSKARELDPLSVVIAAGIAQQSYFERHYDAALTQYGKVLQMDPSFPGIHLHVGLVQLAMGKLTEATEEFRKDAADPNNLGAASLLACVQAISGHVSEARAVLHQLESRRGQQSVPASSLALIHVGLDDKDATFTHLNRAIEEHDFIMRWIKSSPFFDPLRSDPRYAFLLERMNLRTN